MINEGNSSFYLRYLVKVTEEKGITYEEIPQEYIDYFGIPALAQSLNIKVHNPPIPNDSEVEKYIDSNKFDNFESLASGIKRTFQTNIDRLYAAFYYTTHNIEYSKTELSKAEGSHSIEKIFRVRKGVCSDYSDFMINLAKKSGISSKYMKIQPLANASKAIGWNSFNPPKEPDYDYDCVLIEIDGGKFISEPTWGAGACNSQGVFMYSFKTSYFLIPYFRGVLNHFPKDDTTFSWGQYINYPEPNFSSEVALESNPFQRIQVKEGTYDYRVSFLQNINFTCTFEKYENRSWKDKSSSVSYVVKCIGKDLPNRLFSYIPDQKRQSYKISMSFHEIGTFKLSVVGIVVYFDVEKSVEKRIVSSEIDVLNSDVIPIYPFEYFTSFTDGFARVRIAIDSDLSFDYALIYSLKKDSFAVDKELDHSKRKKMVRFFTVDFPSDFQFKKMVECWILIEFPKDGRYKCSFSFLYNKARRNSKPIVYCFDVTGTGKHFEHPFFDLSKSRIFTPLKPLKDDQYLRIEPSTSIVILNDFDFSFHVFAKKNLEVFFSPDVEEDFLKRIYPSFISCEKTDKEDVYDHEYSLTFPNKGRYKLVVKDEKNNLGFQIYYILDDYEQPDELTSDKKLFEKLKINLEKNDTIDTCEDDIPIEIRENVNKMIDDKIKENEKKKNGYDVENDEEEDSQEIIENLKQKALSLEKENEKLRTRFDEMEKRENQMQQEFNKKFNDFKKESENKNLEFFKNIQTKFTNQQNQKDEIEKKEKDKKDKQINDINLQIRKIEKEVLIEPEKQAEIISLQKQIFNEKEDEFLIVSSRKEKKNDDEEISKRSKNKSDEAQSNEKSKSQANSNGNKSSACLLI